MLGPLQQLLLRRLLLKLLVVLLKGGCFCSSSTDLHLIKHHDGQLHRAAEHPA